MPSPKTSQEINNVKLVGKRPKIDRTLGLSGALVVIALILFGLNYWHSVRCYNAHTNEEIEDMDKALKHRLLAAESQTLKSSMFLEKVIAALQERLVETEEIEMSKLAIHSQDEATKTQLLLAKQPSPLKHSFVLDEKYKDAEVLADRVTELLKLVDDEKMRGDHSPEDIFGFGESKDDDFFWKEKEDDKWKGAERGGTGNSASISVEEATKICNEWYKKYNVIPNASWGDLPLEEQTRWIKIGCDRYLLVGSTDGAY